MNTSAKPGKSILDPTFRYRPSHSTDVRETFERIRRELEHAQAQKVVVVKLKKTG